MRKELVDVIDNILRILSTFTNYKQWRISTAIICTFMSIFLHNPDYSSFYSNSSYYSEFSDYRYNWKAIHDQSEHPFTPQQHSITSHQSKRAFRLVPALIGKLFLSKYYSRTIIFLFLIQHLLGFSFFYLFVSFIYHVSKIKVYALILTLGLPFIYLGNSFFWDMYGWFDGVAYFFLISALYSLIRNRFWLVGFFLFIAFWTDERSIIVSPVIFYWMPYIDKNKSKLSEYFVWKELIISYTTAILSYILVRFFLYKYYNLNTPLGFNSLVGFKMIFVNMQAVPFSFLNTFDGYWLLIILSIVWLWKNSFKIYVITSILFFSFSLIAAYCVIDVTRSLTYTFVWVLLALTIFANNTEKRLALIIALVVTVTSFISPNLFFLGKSSLMLSNFHQIKIWLSSLNVF